MKLEEFLTEQHVAFERLQHRPAFSTSRVARLLHVPGNEMAKSVLLRSDHGYVLAVLPTTLKVDLTLLGQNLGEDEMELASEEELEQIFRDCERGAMPPFGSMYHITTVVDRSLTEDEEIVFEAQDHEHAIRMKYRDFAAMEHPQIGHFACRS